MTRRTLIGAGALMILSTAALPAAAQDRSAEVRIWSGQSVRLANPTLEAFYTIMPPKKNDEPPGPSETNSGSGNAAPLLFGSSKALGKLFEKQPDPKQGHRVVEAVTLRAGGAEIRIPLANIEALLFFRQAVASSLPPYVAPTHVLYSGVAILNDGSRVEGDHVSLGTTVLRGTTPQGRVEIPWHEIESVRFTR